MILENPQLPKKGELLCSWRCPRCNKKLIFYKTDNPTVNMIHRQWCEDHEYCYNCKRKIEKEKAKKIILELPIPDYS